MGVRWGLGEADAGGQGGAKSFDPGEWAVPQIPGTTPGTKPTCPRGQEASSVEGS